MLAESHVAVIAMIPKIADLIPGHVYTERKDELATIDIPRVQLSACSPLSSYKTRCTGMTPSICFQGDKEDSQKYFRPS